MISCPKCESHYDSHLSQCPDCNFSPVVLQGFPAWAPDLSQARAEGEFYNPEVFPHLAQLEARHFWFRARNKLILWAIRKHVGIFHCFAELGCGTGFVLAAIADAFPIATILGSEAFVEGLPFASTRVPRATLVQMDARQIPYWSEFDLIGLFDVLEHIKEDDQVLRQINLALVKGGKLILTVPQHMWLWSEADETACHERRYSRSELHRKLRVAGFEVLYSTSFVSLLLPLMMLSRLGTQSVKKDAYAEFRINPTLNTLLEVILDVERVIMKLGLRFPIGGSRLVVAQKKSSL